MDTNLSADTKLRDDALRIGGLKSKRETVKMISSYFHLTRTL